MQNLTYMTLTRLKRNQNKLVRKASRRKRMKMFRWKTAILLLYRFNLRLENRSQRNRLLRERRKNSLRMSLIMMINFVKLTFQVFAHDLRSDIDYISVLFFNQFCRSQYFSIVFPYSSSPFLTNLRLWNFLLSDDHLH